MIWLWLGTFGLEALLYVPGAWKLHKIMAPLLAVYSVFATLLVVPKFVPAVAYVVVAITLFRLFNLLRLIKSRMHDDYLRRVTLRTSVSLLLILLMGIVLTGMFADTSARNVLVILATVHFIVAVVMLADTLWSLRKLRFTMPTEFLSDHDLPTVTVAIPARNETVDLEKCLRSILANDYPKLEIIVLDDCSLPGTADIIRGFAHDGVRFVKGAEPAQRWLAKNQAYQKLYTEASGDLILFCGVDVRLGSRAIRSMVNLLFARRKSMLSVLPTRAESSPKATFIQPMRYLWELAPPRRMFNKPAVLSTCWMIGRNDLKKLGGFKAVSHSIMPEAYFARELIESDEYSFVRSSNELEVQTAKSFREQYDTAVRTAYPKIRRRPEIALLLTIFNVFCLLGPFVGLAVGFMHESYLILPSFSACVALLTMHVVIISVTDASNAVLGACTFPLAVIMETVIGYISMIQYEFYTVTWKGRNISFPIMHVIPRLPKLD